MTFVRALFLTLAVLLAGKLPVNRRFNPFFSHTWTFIPVTTARVINHDTSSSEENDDDDLELTNELRSICLNKTGSNETFERMVEASQNAVICFSEKLDFMELAKDVENLTSSTRVKFFTTSVFRYGVVKEALMNRIFSAIVPSCEIPLVALLHWTMNSVNVWTERNWSY